MEDDIAYFSQKNYGKSTEIEPDKFTESAIPANSNETNNSNVLGSSFEDFLVQTNLNKTSEVKQKKSKKK